MLVAMHGNENMQIFIQNSPLISSQLGFKILHQTEDFGVVQSNAVIKSFA